MDVVAFWQVNGSSVNWFFICIFVFFISQCRVLFMFIFCLNFNVQFTRVEFCIGGVGMSIRQDGEMQLTGSELFNLFNFLCFLNSLFIVICFFQKYYFRVNLILKRRPKIGIFHFIWDFNDDFFALTLLFFSKIVKVRKTLMES